MWFKCILLLLVKVSESDGGVVTIEDMEVESVEVEVYYELLAY